MFHHKQLHNARPLWARQVRLLALDSHQLIHADEPHSIDVELLLGRIDQLRSEVEMLPHPPLVSWLDALRDEVEARTGCLDDSSVVTV